MVSIKKKIVLLGDSAVGKTSLIRRFVFDQFEDSYIATIGSKITKKDMTISREHTREKFTFMIWDIIGREGYAALHSRTFVGVHGAILVADLTRKETLDSLERHWIPSLFKVVERVPLVFVCNKSDIKDEIQFDREELQQIASKYNEKIIRYLPVGYSAHYMTSAKTGENVEKAFETLGHLLLSSEKLPDPVKELYESLIATGIQRSKRLTTPVGAMDAIIVDFCKGFDDTKLAMTILRQEIIRAGLDINNPDKAGVRKVVEYLAEAENEFKDEKIANKNLKRRREWANNIAD